MDGLEQEILNRLRRAGYSHSVDTWRYSHLETKLCSASEKRSEMTYFVDVRGVVTMYNPVIGKDKENEVSERRDYLHENHG